jgi:hypothetical protein
MSWQTIFRGTIMGQRIGYGSYERKNGEQSKEDLRNRFFAAISKHAKHVLNDLYDEPFKLYLQAGLGFNVDAYKEGVEVLNPDERAKKLARAWTKHRWNHPVWQHHFESRPITYDKRKEKFRQSLNEWSRRYNLDAAWCREYAYETLDHWSHYRPNRKNLSFQLHVVSRSVFSRKHDTEWFVFKRRVPHPQFVPIEIAKVELRETFERQLKEFFSRLEAAAKEMQDYMPTKEAYETRKSTLNERLCWLVEHIVYGKSYQTIINDLSTEYEDGLDYSTVRKTII